MQQLFLDLHREIRQSYGHILIELQEAKDSLDVQKSLNDAADDVYALKGMVKVVEHALKELKKVLSQAEKTACLIQLMGEQDKAASEWCSGSAKVSQIVKCPAKRRYDPESFDKLMEFFGVPKETYLSELVRPHWPAVQEELNRRLEQGENVPVQTTEDNVYSFNTRKRKDLP